MLENAETPNEQGAEEQPTPEAQDATEQSDGGSFLKSEGDDANAEKPAEAPAEYAEFTVPDGVKLDDALLAEAAPVFKELGLTQEQAQKLVDFQARMQLGGAKDAAEAKANAEVEAQKQQAKIDNENIATLRNEFGDQYAVKQAAAQRAIRRFDPSGEMLSFVESAGLGTFPPFVRFLAAAGEAISEPSFLASEKPASSEAPKSPAEIMYGG